MQGLTQMLWQHRSHPVFYAWIRQARTCSIAKSAGRDRRELNILSHATVTHSLKQLVVRSSAGVGFESYAFCEYRCNAEPATGNDRKGGDMLNDIACERTKNGED